jgi:prepilin-type N-terminal cleavage/methylation domain-containing protein
MWNIELNGPPGRSTSRVARPLLHREGVTRVRSRGFTLVEMMVVVLIISILATLSVVGFRKLTQSSHVSEATNMVQNIRVAQEGYHSETQQYANITAVASFPSGNGAAGGALYPKTPQYGIQTSWGLACPAGCNAGVDWSVLALHVDGPVLFGYATIANPAACPANIKVDGNVFTLTTPAPADWYAIGAEADLDGSSSGYTDVFGFSWTNQIYVSNEGQ